MNCDYDKDGTTPKEPCKSDRFGDTSAACIEGYFQYDHVYNCSTTDAEYKQGKDACEYTIGVQVKDNWGWCNGNHVVAGTPGGDGNAGFYADDPVLGNKCDIELIDPNKEYYDGYIYVSP